MLNALMHVAGAKNHFSRVKIGENWPNWPAKFRHFAIGGGAWTAKTVKRPRQQPAQPQYANYWALLTRKRHTRPHPAQPRHTNHWAPRTWQRHQQQHRPQWPTESSDPTQHAKGRTGDCPGPRKETTTRRNVTQGGSRVGGRLGVGVGVGGQPPLLNASLPSGGPPMPLLRPSVQVPMTFWRASSGPTTPSAPQRRRVGAHPRGTRPPASGAGWGTCGSRGCPCPNSAWAKAMRRRPRSRRRRRTRRRGPRGRGCRTK